MWCYKLEHTNILAHSTTRYPCKYAASSSSWSEASDSGSVPFTSTLKLQAPVFGGRVHPFYDRTSFPENATPSSLPSISSGTWNTFLNLEAELPIKSNMRPLLKEGSMSAGRGGRAHPRTILRREIVVYVDDLEDTITMSNPGSSRPQSKCSLQAR